MTHVQKPDFVFRRNGRVHLNRRGHQFSRLLAAEVCILAAVMLNTPCSQVVWRVLATPLHSPVSPSLPFPCVTVCHQVSNALYHTVHSPTSYTALPQIFVNPHCHTNIRWAVSEFQFRHQNSETILRCPVYWRFSYDVPNLDPQKPREQRRINFFKLPT